MSWKSALGLRLETCAFWVASTRTFGSGSSTLSPSASNINFVFTPLPPSGVRVTTINDSFTTLNNRQALSFIRMVAVDKSRTESSVPSQFRDSLSRATDNTSKSPNGNPYSKGCRRMMVSSRSAPVEMRSMRASVSSSIFFRYFCALTGSLSKLRTPSVDSFQPGSSS